MSNDDKDLVQKSDIDSDKSDSVRKKEDKNKKVQRKSTYKADADSDFLMKMQKTVGNEEVQRMIKNRVVQARMTVGSPNDVYEKEADAVADKIVNMSDAQVQSKQSDESLVQAKGSPSGMEVPSGFESGLSSIKGTGSQLNKDVRGYYESRLNTYLGDVRVHTGNKADKLARSINAEAFTTGHDIVFAARNFDPATQKGKKLLGHELTHVLQQRKGVQRKGVVQRRGWGKVFITGLDIAADIFTGQVSGGAFNDRSIDILPHLKEKRPLINKDIREKKIEIEKFIKQNPGKQRYVNAYFAVYYTMDNVADGYEQTLNRVEYIGFDISNENLIDESHFDEFAKKRGEIETVNKITCAVYSFPYTEVNKEKAEVASPFTIDNFAFDGVEIPKKGKDILNLLANMHLYKEYVYFFIEGHADKRGSHEYNKQLACDRAEEVKDYLIKIGFRENNVLWSPKSHGENKALLPETESIKKLGSDRKVEVKWWIYDKPRPAVYN